MKLDELLGAKSAMSSIRQGYEDDPLSQPVTRYMTGLGFKLLSSNNDAFSRVYGDPTGRYVVKVFTVEDLGYLHFLDFCKRYGKSPHLPQFYGGRIDLTKHTGVPVYAVRMENLEPISHDSDMAEVLSDIVGNIRDVWGMDADYFIERFRGTPPSLIQVLHALIHEARNTDEPIRVDLHYRNFMQRNGTVVIVDPYAPTTHVDVDYW